MTTIHEITKKCFVCGKSSEHSEIKSTNSFGSPDLDTRPPEMQRSTIDMWVQVCPSCGYSYGDISEGNNNNAEFIKSDSYKKQSTNPEFPKLANAFLCYSLIQENNCEYSFACWSSIHAAWACDDARKEKGAQKCRMKAVSLFVKAKENNQEIFKQEGAEEALMVDLLRRAQQFEMARSMFDDGIRKKPDKVIIDILHFQEKLIRNKDVACYQIKDALKE